MSESTKKSESRLAVRLFAEFWVIVLGVLVALGVDSALETRTERLEESAYYRTLAQDIASDTTQYGQSIRNTERHLGEAYHVRSVILGEDSESTPGRVLQSLYYASWVAYPPLSSGTIDELISSGRIRVIRDQEVKDALHSYRVVVDQWTPRMLGPEGTSHFLEYRRLTGGLIPLELRRDLQLRTTTVEPGAETLKNLVRQLRGDEELLRETDDMILDWIQFTSWWGQMKASATTLLQLLEGKQ